VVLENPAVILIVAGIGLVGNVLSVFLLHGARGETLNIKAAFLHMLYDAISSLAVIIGAVVIIYSGWYFIDPLLASLIGILILWSSFNVLKEATIIFMEAVPRRIDYDRVAKSLKSHPDVIDVHDLHIWALSSTDIALSCHVCLSKEDYPRGPIIIRELTENLNRDFGIGHATFQPEQTDCPSVDIGWFNHDEEKQV
jgi:cobalt-zinc-cadmium efflux system protein